jgi:erythronate-4-phosphate dehydrogenase
MPTPTLIIDAELASSLRHALQPRARLLAVRTAQDIAAMDVARVDALVLRTTQRVGPELARRWPMLRAVITASAGRDHVDMPPGLPVLDGRGGNADGVADWVVWVLLSRYGLHGARPRVGLLGVGATGSRVQARLTGLGFEVVTVDPPRARREYDFPSAPVEALYDCDVLSLHVPLTPHGWPDATVGWLDGERLRAWRGRPFILNAARGEVVDEAALLEALAAGRVSGYAADVFTGEPGPDPALLSAATHVTPHIAGRSDDGRHELHRIVLEQIGELFAWDLAPLPRLPERELPCPWRGAILPFADRCAGFGAAEAALRAAPERFAALRAEHRRRDWGRTRISGGDDAARAQLERVGFRMVGP